MRNLVVGLAVAMVMGAEAVGAQTFILNGGSAFSNPTPSYQSAGGALTITPSGSTLFTRLLIGTRAGQSAGGTVRVSFEGFLNCGVTCQNVLVGTFTEAGVFTATTQFPNLAPTGSTIGFITYEVTRQVLAGGIAPENISLTTAPEPSTYIMLGTGLLALGGVAYRRRRA